MTSQRARDRLATRLREHGIGDTRVLDAIRTVPRHLFIEEALASRAYEDTALPIGCGQTISQPYVVALMTEALLGTPDVTKVLELGTGSGYQAAILHAVGLQVFSVERIEELYKSAKRRFRRLGMRSVRCNFSDGSSGWPEKAPFDAIVLTAAPDDVPSALFEQLRDGGTLVAPVGGQRLQRLIRYVRRGKKIEREDMGGVTFVPMLPGKVEESNRSSGAR